MIYVEKLKDKNTVLLKGDFLDLDRLYFAILKFTGFYGIDTKCTFPGYDAVCENLLGLCYEIRHAWQGDRNIALVYNGVREDWFDDYKEKEAYIDNSVPDPYWEDADEDINDENSFKFSRRDFPNVTNNNTYFGMPITFPEAVFYALILLELLKKKDVFLNTRKLLAEKNDAYAELNKEYYYFQANEDIARITLFTNHVLRTLYRFIGEERYMALFNRFNTQEDFFLNCDLGYINSILTDFTDDSGDPEYLFNVLMCLCHLL